MNTLKQIGSGLKISIQYPTYAFIALILLSVAGEASKLILAASYHWLIILIGSSS